MPNSDVIVYRELLLLDYAPAENQNLLRLLFSSTKYDRVQNFFHPRYLELGNKATVCHGYLEFEGTAIFPERGWIFKRMRKKTDVTQSSVVYTFYEFDVQFTRGGSPAIAHNTNENLVLPPHSEVYALLSGTTENPSKLQWGYLGEVRLKAVLRELQEKELAHG